MNKEELLQLIISRLKADHEVLLQAAKAAHAAATHEENIPDDKYETLALEASYIAQGQANRAQEIDTAIKLFRQLQLQQFTDESPIRLTALVKLEDQDGQLRTVFIGPASGGLQVTSEGRTVQVISPESPMGQALIGNCCGEVFQLGDREYEIIEVH